MWLVFYLLSLLRSHFFGLSSPTRFRCWFKAQSWHYEEYFKLLIPLQMSNVTLTSTSQEIAFFFQFWHDRLQIHSRHNISFYCRIQSAIWTIPIPSTAPTLQWLTFPLLKSTSKLGFYVPFNSQGHIGTGPQHCHLWDSDPQRWQSIVKC